MGKCRNSLNYILDSIEIEEALKEVEFHVCCEVSMGRIREILACGGMTEKEKFLAIRRIIFHGDLS